MPEDLEEVIDAVDINTIDDLREKLKALEINPHTSYARILKILWPGEWVIFTDIQAANNHQSETARRIRELRSEFNFNIVQEDTGNNSRYRLISHQNAKPRRRKYLRDNEKAK